MVRHSFSIEEFAGLVFPLINGSYGRSGCACRYLGVLLDGGVLDTLGHLGNLVAVGAVSLFLLVEALNLLLGLFNVL